MAMGESRTIEHDRAYTVTMANYYCKKTGRIITVTPKDGKLELKRIR